MASSTSAARVASFQNVYLPCLAGVKFGYGGHRRSSALERSARIVEEETTSCHPAPVLDAALQSPKLARREHPWVLPSQTLEQLLRRPMRFGFQPLHDAGPGRLERVPPGAPVSWRSLARTVRRPYLAGTPRERKTPAYSGRKRSLIPVQSDHPSWH